MELTALELRILAEAAEVERTPSHGVGWQTVGAPDEATYLSALTRLYVRRKTDTNPALLRGDPLWGNTEGDHKQLIMLIIKGLTPAGRERLAAGR